MNGGGFFRKFPPSYPDAISIAGLLTVIQVVTAPHFAESAEELKLEFSSLGLRFAVNIITGGAKNGAIKLTFCENNQIVYYVSKLEDNLRLQF